MPRFLTRVQVNASCFRILNRAFVRLSNALFPFSLLPLSPFRSLFIRLRNPYMAPRPHDLSHQDPQDQSLLDAALSGDDLAFTSALSAGADVNVVYDDGRNAILSVLTGQKSVSPNTGSTVLRLLIACIFSWDSADASNAPVMSISRLNILNAIITHRDISLLTLNASSATISGVKSISPLGAAALLKKPTAVQTLLELSPGLVSVDLPDTKGRTPLMCT